MENRPSYADAREPNRHLARLTAIFWICGVSVALLQAWAHRFSLSSEDAVSYLDIADAYARGDWHAAVNAYWSPLYSWILAFANVVVAPSAYWEFFVVKLVNLGLFAIAFGSFGFFLKRLIEHYDATHDAPDDWRIPRSVWVVIGSSLFLWASLVWTGVHLDAPDNLTAACVYLASGLMLEIRREPMRRVRYVLFGLVLGVGYLSKAVMFPLGFVFLAALAAMTGVAVDRSSTSPPGAAPRLPTRNLIAASAAFALVVTPFVAAVSAAKGRVTFGDSGRLNYFWYINRHRDKHWQGDQAASVPAHPTRLIFDQPATFEFAAPIGGTSPTWYDPSYWYEGARIRFDPRQQLRAIAVNVYQYVKWFLGPLLLGYAIVVSAGGRVRQSIRQAGADWFIWLPSAAGLGCYMVAMDMSGGFVSSRLVAPFIVVMCAAVMSSVHLRNSQSRGVAIAAAIVCSLIMSGAMARRAYVDLVTSRHGERPNEWLVARDLQRLGVQGGDFVAVIGDADRNAFWARLARVKIVAQVVRADDFWRTNVMARRQVLMALQATGAKVVVWETRTDLPSQFPREGWQKLENSNGYVYRF